MLGLCMRYLWEDVSDWRDSFGSTGEARDPDSAERDKAIVMRPRANWVVAKSMVIFV